MKYNLVVGKEVPKKLPPAEIPQGRMAESNERIIGYCGPYLWLILDKRTKSWDLTSQTPSFLNNEFVLLPEGSKIELIF